MSKGMRDGLIIFAFGVCYFVLQAWVLPEGRVAT